MTTNSSMTHFHKKNVNHEETWEKNIFSGVMWQAKNIVSPETGFVSSKEVRVYIPILVHDIKEEDIIVKGIAKQLTPDTIKEKFTITSVIICDYGNLKHTELVGK